MLQERQLIEKFNHELDVLSNIQIVSPQKWAIAISGGSDSMALALLTFMYCKAQKIELYGLIVDHKLRPESTSEASYVQQMLLKHGIESEILMWQHEGVATRIQEQAREARYQLMADYCNQHHFTHLLTGHTANDQLETFWMRLNNGSGLKGLCGIKPFSFQNNIALLRPLLSFQKEELQEFLLHNQWSWVEDPSNENVKFERVRIRKTIQYLKGKQLLSFPSVQRSFSKMVEAQEFINHQVNEFKHSQLLNQFKLDDFMPLHPYLQKEILVSYLRDLSFKKYINFSKTIAHILSLVAFPSFKRTTFAGLIIEKKKNIIIFRAENRSRL